MIKLSRRVSLMTRKKTVAIHEMDIDIWNEARIEAIRDNEKLSDWVAKAILFYKRSRYTLNAKPDTKPREKLPE